MTAFMRLLGLVAELGYPSHWISSLVSVIASGEITTTALAPRKYVLTPAAIDLTNASTTICVRPWADEFTTLVAMWRGVWPAGTLVLATDLLPPLGDVSEYSIQFPDFTAPELKFLNPREGRQDFDAVSTDGASRWCRITLLVVEEHQSQVARQAPILALIPEHEREVRKTNTARFWPWGDVVDNILADGWYVCIWRIDTWARVIAGMPFGGAITRKASFGL
ncbi:hypothetical protein F5Y03DRAFT_77910 [Xylaria venustula]|nr:hypothetical protein F5Y03DRAFT_77910 [Xylaria venustula]